MDCAADPTVFLVDDSPWIRERLRELLELDADIRVVGEAATAATAIERIRALHPDFVILDYRLAEGTGLDVLRALNGAAGGSTFIVLTNHANGGVRDACLGSGARFFLDKSREFDRLPAIIADRKGRLPASLQA